MVKLYKTFYSKIIAYGMKVNADTQINDKPINLARIEKKVKRKLNHLAKRSLRVEAKIKRLEDRLTTLKAKLASATTEKRMDKLANKIKRVDAAIEKRKTTLKLITALKGRLAHYL